MDNRCQPKSTSALSLDGALAILASAHRRRVLRLLLEAPESPTEVYEIADRVVDDVDADRESLEIELIHNDLPRLADAGVVEFDRRSGAVRPTETMADLEPLLVCCERWAA